MLMPMPPLFGTLQRQETHLQQQLTIATIVCLTTDSWQDFTPSNKIEISTKKQEVHNVIKGSLPSIVTQTLRHEIIPIKINNDVVRMKK